ncbi:MAG: type VI secretion system membrane subunit TssM [Burkholderiales bacterium]|nr:type VI secretion system membrane subunit TssM [Burkholderiales bacterium]
MGKILGLLFNRWTLGALLLAAFLAVLWIIGPLVAVGTWRPLESSTSRWVLTGIVLALVVALVAWKLVRARQGNRKVVEQLAATPAGAAAAPESPEVAAVRKRFAEALLTLRNARFGTAAASGQGLWARLKNQLGGRYLYQLPWYLIIGAPGAGKTTALRNAGLNFPLAKQLGEHAVRGVGGTRLCDWWFTDQAVLIDTAGRFTTQDSDAAQDKATWNGFVDLLKRSRKRQPLNGVLVTVSVADLVGKSAHERELHAQSVRARVQELHEQLRIRIPIYLLVTKCDLLAGFAEHFAALDKDQRAAPWGFTFPLTPASAWSERLQPEFNALLERLDQGLIDRLQAEGDTVRRSRIYGFPSQFANLAAPLADFTRQVFAPSPYEAEPMLRGLYFVSGTQEGTPIDRVLGAVARRYRIEQSILPPQKSSGRSFFLQRLLTEVVFAEHGLAGTDRRWERQRNAWAIAGYAAVGLVSLGLLGAWTMSWRNNAAYVQAVSQRVDLVRRQVQETPNRTTADLLPVLPALEATRRLATDAGPVPTAGDAGSVPWSLGFGLYQGEKLDGAARGAYQRMLVDAVQPRLALRIEEQLRASEQPDSLYEALKAYLMMYEPARFEAPALKQHIEADWEARLGREISVEQRAALSGHLDALLERGATVSPLPRDQALIESTRTRLAAVPLQQRVYNRLRQRGLGAEFREVTVAEAGGPNAQLVFVRASGLPLTKGVSGLFTYDGYHKGFQKVVGEVTKTLAAEQSWVLGIEPVPMLTTAAAPGQTAGQAAGPVVAQAADGLLGSGKLVNDVRRLYLNEYRETWRAYIADVRLQPLTSMAQAIEKTRFLAGPDTPLVPMLRRFSKETTLLAPQPGAAGVAGSLVERGRQAVSGALGGAAPLIAPGERLENIVDDEFRTLRAMVTGPEGGKPPIEGLIERLKELQVHLIAVDQALKAKAPPPTSPLPNQLKAEGGSSPEPVRGLLDSLGSSAGRAASIALRGSLAAEVRSAVGEFCQQAITGRYPFDPTAAREVTPADFAALFGPGGKFEQMQTKLAPYIDTSTRPWRFLPVDGAPLGTDLGTLPQFQRAKEIRDAFFATGPMPGVRLVMKPFEMDARLKEFLLDVDGQLLRYDHGPQIPVEIKWPGPRGSGVVRVTVQPAGGSGLVNDGAWALFRLFERVTITPGNSSEKFRATFDIDGRKAIFDVTSSSVRNPLRLPDVRSFQCPNGL